MEGKVPEAFLREEDDEAPAAAEEWCGQGDDGFIIYDDEEDLTFS